MSGPRQFDCTRPAISHPVARRARLLVEQAKATSPPQEIEPRPHGESARTQHTSGPGDSVPAANDDELSTRTETRPIKFRPIPSKNNHAISSRQPDSPAQPASPRSAFAVHRSVPCCLFPRSAFPWRSVYTDGNAPESLPINANHRRQNQSSLRRPTWRLHLPPAGDCPSISLNVVQKFSRPGRHTSRAWRQAVLRSRRSCVLAFPTPCHPAWRCQLPPAGDCPSISLNPAQKKFHLQTLSAFWHFCLLAFSAPFQPFQTSSPPPLPTRPLFASGRFGVTALGTTFQEFAQVPRFSQRQTPRPRSSAKPDAAQRKRTRRPARASQEAVPLAVEFQRRRAARHAPATSSASVAGSGTSVYSPTIDAPTYGPLSNIRPFAVVPSW